LYVIKNRKAEAASENVSETTCKGQFPSENILYVAWERLSFVSNLTELGGALVCWSGLVEGTVYPSARSDTWIRICH